MARTPEGALLTQRHRGLQLAIRASALQDLLRLWGTVEPIDLAGTVRAFASAAAVVVRGRNRDSAAAAARYFQAFRAAEGARGSAAIFVPDPPTVDEVSGLVRGAAVSGIMHGRRQGFSVQAAARNGFTRVAGASTNLVLDGGRQVITEAVASDRASTGRWQRVTASQCCSFCAMLAQRGPVFDARTSRFEAHAGCSCGAEPAYQDTRLPAASQRFREEWAQAQRDVLPGIRGSTNNDDLNAFRQLREGRVPTPSAATAED